MPDAHANFAVSTVATAPSPATSGTSLVVTTGEGTRFPAVPFNATVAPANTQPTPANAEIVRVTARTTDTLTITRAQESSVARTIVVGDQIAATITAKTLTDAESGYEIGYAERTTSVTITAAAEATPTDLGISLGAITFDGTAVFFQFGCADITMTTGIILLLFDASTMLCRIGDVRYSGEAAGMFGIRLTPSAASHTYNMQAIRTGGANATLNAGTGSGGAGTYSPAFLRATKA